MDWDRTDVSRRIQAAVALAGYRSAEKFATEKTVPRGIGVKRVRQLIQRKGDEPRAVELREIAGAAELPYEFFTAELSALGAPVAGEWQQAVRDLRADMDTRLQGLQTAIDALTSSGQAQPRGTGSTRQSRSRRKRPPGTP
jgi:hypothetical protein